MADLARLRRRRAGGEKGLALMNSNGFATGITALAIADLERLVGALDVAGALDLEAFTNLSTLLHPAIGQVRPYPGIVESPLAALRGLLGGAGSPAPRGTSNRFYRSAASHRCTAPSETRSASAGGLRDRAECVAGKTTCPPRRGPHRLGRELRHPAPVRRARLPAHRARLGAHVRVRRTEKLMQGHLTGLPNSSPRGRAWRRTRSASSASPPRA